MTAASLLSLIPLLEFGPSGGVHILQFAADERLIHLYRATLLPAELAFVFVSHGQPDTMEEKPSGLLRNAEETVQSRGWKRSFLQLAIIHIPMSHSIESEWPTPRTVPTLTENWHFRCRVLHCQRWRRGM